MTEQQATRQRRLDREKAAYRYTTALDNGDIDTIATVLQQAERDPELEQMILVYLVCTCSYTNLRSKLQRVPARGDASVPTRLIERFANRY